MGRETSSGCTVTDRYANLVEPMSTPGLYLYRPKLHFYEFGEKIYIIVKLKYFSLILCQNYAWNIEIY